jgi:hypothetical protein
LLSFRGRSTTVGVERSSAAFVGNGAPGMKAASAAGVKRHLADLIRLWRIRRERRRLNRALANGRTERACECWQAIRELEQQGRR